MHPSALVTFQLMSFQLEPNCFDKLDIRGEKRFIINYATKLRLNWQLQNVLCSDFSQTRRNLVRINRA